MEKDLRQSSFTGDCLEIRGRRIGDRLQKWLDNNVCERALKKAILHRKGALFYKTQNGAHVGDLFMSLIHTCQLCEVDPFDYLTEVQRHAEDLPGSPHNWMPWSYRETLLRKAEPPVAPP